MPKMKTNRSAAKRFKKTKSGAYKRKRATAGHIMTHKTTKRVRRLRHTTTVSHADLNRVKGMLPNG